MTRDRQFASHLCLADTQKIFLIAMIDFNLPTIKTGLHQEFGGRLQISRQKVSRLAIIQVRVLRQLVRYRRDHNQTQRRSAGATLPQHFINLFIFHSAMFVTEIDQDAVPGIVRLDTHMVGSEQFRCIFTTPSFWRSKTQSRVPAAWSQQMSAIQLRLEHSFIGEAAITNYQQLSIDSSSVIEALTQADNHLQRLRREVLLLFSLLIFLELLGARAFARLFQWRRFLKSHRDATRRIIAFLIMGKQQQCLEESQPKHEIQVKRRRQRIAMPACSVDLSPSLSKLCVIYGRNHRTLWVPLQVFVQNRIEKPVGLPSTSREHFVIGTPVLIPSSQRTQSPRDRSATQYTRQSNRVLNSTIVASTCGERRPPTTIKQ